MGRVLNFCKYMLLVNWKNTIYIHFFFLNPMYVRMGPYYECIFRVFQNNIVKFKIETHLTCD